MTRPTRRVPDGVRPNVVARIPGASPRRLWILGHMDVVPPGELSYWKTDPWKVVVDGDKIRGRGVEDNQQAIVCGLLIAQELKAQGITPDLSLGLIFVSDEETSSRYGIHYILKTHADLFGPDDFVVVPDYGVADGSSIEISEKGQLWMRVEVLGHQCHASAPQEGRNSPGRRRRYDSAREGSGIHLCSGRSAVPAPVLHVRPDAPRRERPQYQFPAGQGRVLHRLPHSAGISHDDVLASAREIMEAVAERHGVTVDITTVTNAPASPATPPDSEVVLRLSAGIREIYGIEPHCDGSGGGTVAVGFRDMGIPAAVWASVVPTYHLANEYSLISRTIGDAQVLARMLFD